ncbi:hypothetical protein MTO96_014926 [Rhipicephalus appendiculatus]
MSSGADDRGANQVPSPALSGDPSKDLPSPLSESSVRKKQRRSKLGTASRSKRPHRQNRRSSRGAFKKVPGAQDNTQSGTTQEPAHDAPPGGKETQAMASDLASTASSKIRGPRHSHERIDEKRRGSGTTRTARTGSSSAVELLSSLSSLDIPPVSETLSHRAELRESPHELDRGTESKSSTRGEQTTDLAGKLLEVPQAATSPLTLSTPQGSTLSAPMKAHGDDVPHESLEHVTRTSHGSLMPSAAVTLISTPKVAPATTVSSPGTARNARGTSAMNHGYHSPGRRDNVKDTTNSSNALTAAKGEVDPVGGRRPTDGMVNLESEGAPTTISAVAPLSETGAQVSATTDQQPETALREMANLPTMLDRLLNPLRKRAYFGSVTLRLLSPRSTLTLTTTPRKNRSWSFSTDDKWPQVAVVTILAVATLLVMYSLFHGTSGSGGGDTSGNSPTLCQTADCIRHADLFAHWLNDSIDPCEDFAAFVCSAWAYGAQYRRGESTSVRQEIVFDFTEQVAETMAAGTTQIPVGSKPLAMFRTCMEVTAHSAHTKEVIRRFLADEGVPWPRSMHSPIYGIALSPLEILMRFAIKWQLPLWFNVLVLPKFAGGQRAVLIADNPKMRGWAAIHKGLEATNSIFEYWSAHYEALSPQGYGQMRQQPSQSECEQMSRIEDTVYRELLYDRDGEAKQSAMFPMESIDNYTRGAFSSSEWLESLNNQASATDQSRFTARDPVVLRDTGLLAGLRRIWATYGEAKLLEALAWLLAQILGPIADAALLRFRYGNLATPNIRRVHFCVSEVEEVYRFLVIALATAVNFREGLRLNISSRLAIVQQTAAALVEALPWLDNATKIAAGKKVSRAKTLLWPPDDFLAEDTLSIMYSGFPEDVQSAGETFADLWLQSRQALSDLETDRDYEDRATDMPANTRLPLADYDYVRNTVRISVQALCAPLYYPQGTNAMFYGGLGFVYARELVKSLDGEGVTFDADGNVGHDWSSDVWKITMLERTFCLAAQSGSTIKRAPKTEEHRLFPDIPALEVAYAALEWALALDPHPTRVLEQYTEQQLFFITLCYIMCGAVQPGPRDCNKALRHFPPFAQHFNCSQGSRMKATKPCSLLYIPNSQSDSD